MHAGGIVWSGPYLHVAATARGLMTCRVDDILRVPDVRGSRAWDRLGLDGDEVASYGYRYVLPVRFSYRAHADEGTERLRYSFLSLDRSADPPVLVAGEYGRSGQTTRLARFDLDPDTLLLATGDDGYSRPIGIDEGGVVADAGRRRSSRAATTSPCRTARGSPARCTPARPATSPAPWAMPMGPEDIAYWPSTDRFWSVSEHPRRRWVFSMKRSRFD